MENKKLHLKISALVLTTVAVIASMTATLVYKRERIREIEAEPVLLLTASDIHIELYGKIL